MKSLIQNIEALGRRIKRAVLSRVAIPYHGDPDKRHIAPDSFHSMFVKVVHQTLSERNVKAEDVPAILARFEADMPDLADKLGENFFQSLELNIPVIVTDRLALENRFRKRHRELWKRGLDYLLALIVISEEIGEEANRRLRAKMDSAQRLRVEALTRLHARSIYLAKEIHSLLASGFPDGAQARWRTLHEVAVVSTVLGNGTDDLVQRYFDHDGIESWYAACEHNKHSATIGSQPFSDSDMVRMKTRFEELETKYGGPYKTAYGWAASALDLPRPGLEDLEKSVRLDWFRPYYRMASHPTHANPKGIGFQLGNLPGHGVLVAGPSNFGLTDPAQCTAEAIYYSTLPLLEMRGNLDVLVLKRTLWKFVESVGEAFWDVQKTMEEAERARRAL